LKRIAILLHERQRGKRTRYVIDSLCEVWQRRGFEVSYLYGIKTRPVADLLIPHVDLTHTPPEYVEYIRSFPNVINRDVTDISKRRISTHLLRAGEDYRGPVIVKTDNNSGGRPEYWLWRRRHPVFARLWRRVVPVAEGVFGRRFAWRRLLDKYPIYNSLSEVPPGVFRNPALVVERFLPEREGDRYFMRHYLFLGDRARNVRVADSTPFMRRSWAVPVDEGLPVPEQVLAFRRRLGMDYGKIDYTIHNGEVVIVDVNRTPGGRAVPGHMPPCAMSCAILDLADGIRSLLLNK